ncbi:MAG TPA: tetratricopeptide repeat protein [Pyrinomonadaceae bacterium]
MARVSSGVARSFRLCQPARLCAALFLCLHLCLTSASAQGSNGLLQRLERAAALVRDDRLAEAEKEIASVMKVAPEEAGALNLLGTVRARQGRLDEAEALFLRAVRSDASFVAPHMNLAYLYMLKRAPEKTIQELREVLRLDPRNADAGGKLAQLLFSSNQTDEGIRLVERLKEQSPPLSAALLAALGDAYASRSDFEKAEESYLLAVRQQDNNVDAILGLARTAHARGDGAGAARQLARARQLVAASPDLLYRFAGVALRLNFGGEASAALAKALELKPDEPAYLLLQGVAWLSKPDVFEAEKSFRRFIELRPDNAQGQMLLGYALLKQKRSAEARAWLEKSIKTELNMPEPFYYLGLIAQEQNEDLRAVELLEKAVKILPTYAHAHTALGASYLKLKNLQRAQQELELAVKLNPEDSKAHYNLALLYARLKEPARAQEQMRIVEKLKSTSKAGGAEAEAFAPAPAPPR